MKLQNILSLNDLYTNQISGTEKSKKRMAPFGKYVLPTVTFKAINVGIGRQSHRSSAPKGKQ